VPVEEIAAEVRLSPSRLMSVAHEQLGTSLRRYRRWLRMFRVARDYAGGASLRHSSVADPHPGRAVRNSRDALRSASPRPEERGAQPEADGCVMPPRPRSTG
jgi:hypothetical protein